MNIGFIGAGNMGGALARALSTNKETNIYIFDINIEKAELLASEIGATVYEKETLLSISDFIFLGVKPKGIADVCKNIRDGIKADAAIISMAAGVEIKKLEASLGEGIPVIRIMPNTPVTYGAGMTAFCKNEFVSEKMLSHFKEMMKYTGTIAEIPEDKFEAFTAVAGCSPAYAYMFIDAIANAGAKCGLDYSDALSYASKMLEGAALMVRNSPLSPTVLKENVCSPGGSTIEGVYVLEGADFDGTVQKAIIAAFNKTKELGKQ